MEMEIVTVVNGDAKITYSIPKDAVYANRVYKKIRKIVAELDKIKNYNDFYLVFKTLKPSNEYDILSIGYHDVSDWRGNNLHISFNKEAEEEGESELEIREEEIDEE